MVAAAGSRFGGRACTKGQMGVGIADAVVDVQFHQNGSVAVGQRIEVMVISPRARVPCIWAASNGTLSVGRHILSCRIVAKNPQKVEYPVDSK